MSADPGLFRYFGYAMILLYASVGLFIILSPAMFYFMTGWQRIGSGVLLIIYGAYRFSRIKDRYQR